MQLTVATFNIENLFTRFDFSAFGTGRDAERARRYLPPIVNFLADFDGGDLANFEDFRSLVQAASVSQDDDKRQHTALALHETDAQLLCLQEVDSVGALSRFNDSYIKKLGGRDYKQLVLHDGNDFRELMLLLWQRRILLYYRAHTPLSHLVILVIEMHVMHLFLSIHW